MKDFTLGHIYCKCSVRMKYVGKAIRMYEATTHRKKCPNCKKKRDVLFKKTQPFYSKRF